MSVPTAFALLLVRHAVAAERGLDFPDDAQRPLTADGMDRFRRAVAGLRTLGLQLDLVVTSPYLRARQTADLLCAGLRSKPKLVVDPVLAPGRRPVEVITAITGHIAGGRGRSSIALVGHEPDLGVLAGRLLGARGAIPFKKGAMCCLDLDRALPGGPGTLRWFLPPRVLRGLTP